MKKLLILVFLMTTAVVFAQKKKKEDVAAIKKMCGCYEVKFNFAETFSPNKDYEYHENYSSGALELVLPIEETKDKIVLQHLLVIGDTMIIKHWRQDWLYENTDFYSYHKDNTWKYEAKAANEVAGQWTQKVYQVDDGPRYEGSATWVHVDGKSYWENTADAPLPRREFSKRSDYNVMQRTNRQEITDFGWVHEQDNAKINRTSSDETIAFEKGWNTYTKVEGNKCEVAEKWWATNVVFWTDVRLVWDQLFAQNRDVAINMKVEDKVMFQRIFALQKTLMADGYNSAEGKVKIKKVFIKHLKGDVKLASN